jgi:Cytidylate kinase
MIATPASHLVARAGQRAHADDEDLSYLEAVHEYLGALMQSFRREPPREIEVRMRDAMLALRRMRQVLRLRPRTPVRLFELERRFRLDEFESFVLSMLAAYLFSGEIRQEIAAISETKMDYVSLELLLRLYFPTRGARMVAQREFTSGTLLTEHLVELTAARTPSELLYAPLELQPHTAHYLLRAPVLREAMPLACELVPPDHEPFVERALGDHLLAVCRAQAAPRILLGGPVGAGKSTLARQLAGQLGRELLSLTGPLRAGNWRALAAKVRVHDAFVLFRHCAPLLQSPSHEFLEALDRMDVPVLLVSASGLDVAGRVRRRMDVVAEIEETTATERATVWRARLAQAYGAPPAALTGAVVDEICEAFKLTRPQIAKAVAALRRQSPDPPDRDRVWQACERQLH